MSTEKEKCPYRFEVFKSLKKGKQFYWRMVTAKNGNIVAQSEGYTRRNNATQTVKNIAKSFSAKPEVWILENDGATLVSY